MSFGRPMMANLHQPLPAEDVDVDFPTRLPGDSCGIMLELRLVGSKMLVRYRIAALHSLAQEVVVSH